MTTAYNQLLRAHVLAYNALHDLYAARGWPTPMVTFQQLLQRPLLVRQNAARSALRARARRRREDEIGDHICQRAQRV